ncbi:nucleotidyl transferase AbiEii/AbiGii toxin family protein [Arcobacter arenosus]|uniref:Nucleotidyl transferase AbiEii/AbiGii toxin family protein n=1 Tax=Arcobacter arenosus TaxID=2576037 RepID=A0A5R8Y3A7_9BACT|nr:nucleotidyl transferase AbiEii/AbiGii toxin family protein [Arcobacter arenosus]TLP39421.1 nucleotidyl transferase AbiEii/AbiGii toxin family protein [Arcobacter arenosus]
MDNIVNLLKEERQELFSETARLMHTTNAIVEKDFWLVWTLSKIFSDERLNKILMFKGGTSLSKVFHLIGRFSEDIDLILDWNLVSQTDPNDERSKNKQDKYNKEVNETAKVYIKDELLPIMSELLSPHCICKIDEEDEHNINITYPSSFKDDYLRPQILLEIGPLASWLPHDNYEISSYAAEHFPDLFTQVKCNVNAIVAHRTFWEKATILHQEAHRAEEKTMPPRYSRHYYDLAIMATSNVKDDALKDLDLLEKVVEFKKKFYPVNWANYDSAKVGTLKLIPPKYRIKELEEDYKAMGNMIFDKHLEFDEIIEILTNLENEINS